MAMAATLELDDIQGLVARGYSSLKAASFLMLEISDPQAARRSLGQLALRVTDGRSEPAATAVNVAFTSDGLRRLGVETPGIDGFPEEFVSGMSEANRSRFLGDTGPNAPLRWEWGGPATRPVHLLVLTYAQDEQRLEELEAEIHRELLATGGLVEAVRLRTSRLGEREPFGFRDGISQPLMEGLSKATAVREGDGGSRTGHQGGGIRARLPQ
ncbi:hypothetical protein GCM10020000_02210 [Streptomyces olivoverticillatus]